MQIDPFQKLKNAQREGWALFAPLETITTPTAATLVRFAEIRAGQRVLDVACGTGVVAITAARLGAVVQGLDLSPVLLRRAEANASIAGVNVGLSEGDLESLPFHDGEFDVVVSQFGHMFAPRPSVATSEMLRVLKPGGTLAFSTWPPEMFMGRMFHLVNQYLPPPVGVPPTTDWGTPETVRERLGVAIRDLYFERNLMTTAALSPMHFRDLFERTSAPIIKLLQSLNNDPARLVEFRTCFDALATEYFHNNTMRQHYLMSRAVKA